MSGGRLERLIFIYNAGVARRGAQVRLGGDLSVFVVRGAVRRGPLARLSRGVAAARRFLAPPRFSYAYSALAAEPLPLIGHDGADGLVVVPDAATLNRLATLDALIAALVARLDLRAPSRDHVS